MSQMGDSVVGEVTATLKLIKELLQFLIEILMKLEQHHHERVMRDKSITRKVAGGAAALIGSKAKGLNKYVKKKIMSGEIDMKTFSKLQKNTQFNYMTLPTSKLPEISESCKKAGIPIFTAENGNNISAVAVPVENMQAVDDMLKRMISRDANRDKGWEFNQNTDFKGVEKEIFHNIINSYDIPTISFKKQDGTELIAVPGEFQEQYIDAVAEAKETIKDISNIEIADGFVWDDPNTTAIEVTPLQARQLDDYYKNVKVVDVDGKLYAYGKDIEQDVNKVIEEDQTIEKSANEWKIGVIDNTITLNKKALLGREEETSQLIKLPGEQDHYIRFDKSELEEADSGKTLKSKLDYERAYEICDADGNMIESRKGEDLAGIFNTKSPFHSQTNETTDRSMYGNFLNRIELFNERTNKLVSIPISNAEEIRNSLIHRAGVDEKTAERIMSKISPMLSEDFSMNKDLPKESRDYTAGKTTQNAVKAAIMAQKLKGYTCKNGNEELSQNEGYAVIDKRTQEYVFVDKEHWYQLDDKLKEMGYNSIERDAVVSKLKQTYDINGEIEHSINYEQTFSTVSPALKNISAAEYGNGSTTIFNVDPDNKKLDYVVIDKEVSTLDFEKLCKDKLGINDDSAIAELTEKIGDKLRKPTELSNNRIDGVNYSISQLTSKYIRISDGKNTVTANKNTLNSEKIAKQLNIDDKSADKIIKNVSASFKAKEGTNKDILSLSKLKSVAAKEVELRKETEKVVDAKGQTKSEKTHSSERSL